MNPAPATVVLGVLTQAEFDSVDAPTQEKIEKGSRDLRQHYDDSWFQTNRDRLRAELAEFFDVALED